MPNKKLCGLHGAHVKISQFNNNGNCQCLGCPGLHCHECSTFDDYAAQSAEYGERTKCFLCQTFRTKNR